MATAHTDWYEVCKTRAEIRANTAHESGIQAHELTTAIGTVYVTFEGKQGDHITGTIWTDKPVRVNHHEYRISGQYHYFLSPSHWENSKRIVHDPPVPCASFSAADMIREGNHNATQNANWKAELAIGAAIAKLNHETHGMLAAQAALNARESGAQTQETHAKRARARVAEWIAHAERHERNAAAIRAGRTLPDYELRECRVY